MSTKMEVGAVKHAFNNEIIHIKKKLNQARTNVISKLTRKAKTLKCKKKPPDHLIEKFNRKADLAVAEVLLLKKIKAKNLLKFAVTHKGSLKDYLNKPSADEEKALARILLHKSMEDKYNYLRDTFANMPVEELLLTRKERLKIKKENNEKKKKAEGKKADGAIGSNWDVEDITIPESKTITIDVISDDIKANKEENSGLLDEENEKLENQINDNIHDNSDSKKNGYIKDRNITIINKKVDVANNAKSSVAITNKNEVLNTVKKKIKQKNKSSEKKLHPRNLHKEIPSQEPIAPVKIVDSFFLTESGDNYMTLAEPRPPDEVKESHTDGNRKLRRAVMFGTVPRHKVRRLDDNNQNNFSTNNRFNTKGNNKVHNDQKYRSETTDIPLVSHKANNSKKFDSKTVKNDNIVANSEPEKLHPSWEAKKRQSGLLPFKGKKVIFD